MANTSSPSRTSSTASSPTWPSSLPSRMSPNGTPLVKSGPEGFFSSMGRSRAGSGLALADYTPHTAPRPARGCSRRRHPDKSEGHRGNAMDFELSEEQRAIQDMARGFARDEMMPHAKDWDENSTFPVEALRKAAALGFGGI